MFTNKDQFKNRPEIIHILNCSIYLIEKIGNIKNNSCFRR